MASFRTSNLLAAVRSAFALSVNLVSGMFSGGGLQASRIMVLNLSTQSATFTSFFFVLSEDTTNLPSASM
uniref:Putative secreted protein n=1 Tax=Ixodes ricinus TaxID=34613 RepID=A0A6B0TRI0_IXORI